MNTQHQQQNIPGELLERLGTIYDPEVAGLVEASFASLPPLSFRVIGNDGARSGVVEELRESGFAPEPVPWCKGAFVARGGTRHGLQDTVSWSEGRIFIQSLSSMAAAVALEVEPGHHVLDLCAAPGGKTAMLGLDQRGRGVLLANDRSRKRLASLRSVLDQHGVSHAELQNRTGESYGGTHRDCFDRVLVDAPCSGEAMLRQDDVAGCEDWSTRRIRRLASQQARLLTAGLRTLKPGGILVYSTCTYAPEENEGVLDKVLRRIDVPVEIDPLPMFLPEGLPGLREWEGVSYDTSIRHGLRLVPGGDCTGFFIARLRRSSSDS